MLGLADLELLTWMLHKRPGHTERITWLGSNLCWRILSCVANTCFLSTTTLNRSRDHLQPHFISYTLAIQTIIIVKRLQQIQTPHPDARAHVQELSAMEKPAEDPLGNRPGRDQESSRPKPGERPHQDRGAVCRRAVHFFVWWCGESKSS